MSHTHHDDCKHRHEHNNKCEHGSPTGTPKRGTCGVCNGALNTKSVAFCQVHRRWECRIHVAEGIYHNREKMAKARAEEAKEV